MKFLTFDETRDFPFYKHNPKISKSAWFVLLLCVAVSFLISSIITIFSEIIGWDCILFWNIDTFIILFKLEL